LAPEQGALSIYGHPEKEKAVEESSKEACCTEACETSCKKGFEGTSAQGGKEGVENIRAETFPS